MAFGQVDGKQTELNSTPLSRLKQNELDWLKGSGQRVYQSELPDAASVVLTTDMAYFLYLGPAYKDETFNHLEVYLNTVAAGTIVNEFGVFSTPLPGGQRVAQTLTKLISTNATDVLTSTGLKRNTNNFALNTVAGTHLWGGVHCTASTTRPGFHGVTGDWGDGFILVRATNGLFSAAATFAGALVTPSVAWQAPLMRLTRD